ncbi:MAG: TonB family protein [Candidatus Acidiferrales bacterium]
MQRRDRDEIQLIELSPHSRLPRLDLGVDWESPWQEFRTSVRDFFTGPRAPKNAGAGNSMFRVEWVRDKVPGWAFTASTLWHILIVLLLILPIWGFLPVTQDNLAPVRIELTYLPSQDLPPISPPGPVSKPSPAGDPAKPLPQLGADAYHPRQTILSIPLHVTHPRQTLIQPDAPMAAPKIDTPLPNMVQWSAPAIPRPQFRISPTKVAPRMQRRAAQDVAAPEIPNAEKNPGPLNVAATPIANQQPQLPISPMSTAAAASVRRQTNQDVGPAPEVGAASAGDPDLHQVIALSASPAPPAAEVSVPSGNSAAHVAISPEGKQAGVPGGVERGAPGNGGSGGNAESMGGTNGAGGATRGSGGGGNTNHGSAPVGVSISGGSNTGGTSGGGITPAGTRPSGKLNLKLAPSSEPPGSARRATIDVSHLDPGLQPEKILSGKEILPLRVNMPNMTSVAGSWIFNCAQLDEGGGPAFQQKGNLSGPEPLEKVDPKYPQSIIEQHVDGEVVLYAIIRKDGSVDSIQIVRRLEPQLDRNSMEALARWKFKPGTRAGVPVDFEAVVHIPFRFRNPNDQ